MADDYFSNIYWLGNVFEVEHDSVKTKKEQKYLLLSDHQLGDFDS